MPLSFKYYHDGALSQANSSINPLVTPQKTDGSLAPVDHQVWYGSTEAGRKVQALSDPGVDHIYVIPVDLSSGTGLPATSMKLALSQGGLDSAVGGDPVDLGVEVLSGVGNAATFWVRHVDTTGEVGTYTDVVFRHTDVQEVAV